jgi:hypothetical protein
VAISTGIGLKGAQSLYYAVGEYADTIGLPLTHLVTIDFACTTVDPHDIPRFLSRLLELLRKRLTRPPAGVAKVRPTWVWVLENARGKRPIMVLSPEGHHLHAHLAIHLPPSRVAEIRAYIVQQLASVARDQRNDRILDFKPMTSARGLRQYLLKGTTEKWAARFGVPAPKAQGVVPGARSRTSRNLGPAARRATDRLLGIKRRRPRIAQTDKNRSRVARPLK